MNNKTVDEIKRFLALGIPMSGHMNSGGASSDGDNTAFQLYRSGIAKGDCPTYGSNHQITLVGYGHYKGTPVWLWMNSWGSSWG